MSSPADPLRGTLVVLAGPTGAGKTVLSQGLAEVLDAEIVVADALCVYRGMDIGTAKPDSSAQAAVRHHCLDLVDPTSEYSVADYQRDARAAIDDILGRGRLPMLVGGSGLYLRAATDEVSFGAAPDPERRRRLETMPLDALVGLLEGLSPARAARVDLDNPRRVLRQVEQALDDRSPHTGGWTDRKSSHEVRFAVVCPSDRALLYADIDTRTDEMLAAGWAHEVDRLWSEYRTLSRTARAAIGYAELRLALDGEIAMSEAAVRIKRRTRALARRQLTWFRREPRAVWFDMTAGRGEAEEELLRFLSGREPTQR